MLVFILLYLTITEVLNLFVFDQYIWCIWFKYKSISQLHIKFFVCHCKLTEPEVYADMPPGTDCPYPIRIFAFFEMIRPYHVVIRIWGKLLKNNLCICVAKQNSLSSTQLAFSAKFLEKNGRFRLRWSTIDLVNQRRRPNPTVAPREIKFRFSLFSAGCRFLLHNVEIFFCKLHRDMNRVNIFAIHRCINEGYGLIRIFSEKIRISPTKLWHVCLWHIHYWNKLLRTVTAAIHMLLD